MKVIVLVGAQPVEGQPAAPTSFTLAAEQMCEWIGGGGMGLGEMEEGAGQGFREGIGGGGGQCGTRHDSSSSPLAAKLLAQLTRLFGEDGETQQQPAAEKYVAKEEKGQERQECNHTD
jgi:hypothetical protein